MDLLRHSSYKYDASFSFKWSTEPNYAKKEEANVLQTNNNYALFFQYCKTTIVYQLRKAAINEWLKFCLGADGK